VGCFKCKIFFSQAHFKLFNTLQKCVWHQFTTISNLRALYVEKNLFCPFAYEQALADSGEKKKSLSTGKPQGRNRLREG